MIGSLTPGAKSRERFVVRLSHLLAGAAGLILFVLFAINVLQIAVRPFTGGWIWVNDLSRLLVAWAVMIGAAAAYGLRQHLVVDLVVQHARPRFRAVSAVVVRAAEIGIGVVLLVSGLTVAMARMNIQYIQLGIPTGYAFLAVPVLGFFMLLFGITMSRQTPDAAASAPSSTVPEGGHR